MNRTKEKFSPIRRVVRRTRLLWRANEAVLGLSLLGVALALMLIVGALAGTGWVGRLWLMLVGGLFVAAVLGRYVIFPLARRVSDDDAALLLEGKYPEFKERLITAIQLWGGYESGRGGFSRELYEKLLEEVAELSGQCRAREVLRWGRTATALAAAVVLAAVFAAVAQRQPGGFGMAKAFVTPPYIPQREVYRLVEVTGDVRVARGGGAGVRAVFEGFMRGKPVVEVQREALEPLRIAMRRGKAREGRYAFGAEIKNVADDVEYRLVYRTFRSRLFRVSVVDPPSVKRVGLRLVYPKHTGILPESFRGGGDVRAPYGTKVSVEVEATRKLRLAWIKLNNKERHEMELASGNTAKAGFTIKKSGGYSVHLVGELDLKNAAPPVFSITSVPDEPPAIHILAPKEELRQARTEPVPVRAAAEDDYEVSAVSLRYEVVGMEKKGKVKIPIAPAQNIDFEYRWKLTDVPAYEGDTVEFCLEAVDNDALTGPKTAVSETRRVVIVSEAEDYRNIEEIQEEIFSQLESVMREGTTVAGQFEDLRREIGKGRLGQKGQADLQRTLQRQADMERELRNISDSLSGSIDRMMLNKLIGPSTIDKMRQINEMMSQVMTDDMRESLKNIQEAVKGMKLPALDRLMLEAVMDQEKLNRSLDLTLKRLRRAKAEQGVQALAKQLERLIREQQKVIEATKELQKKEAGGLSAADRREAGQLAREEDRLSDRMGDLRQDMESLRAAFEAVDRRLASDLNDLKSAEITERARGHLSEASSRLSGMMCGGALPSEESALEQMLLLKSNLDGFACNYTGQMYADAQRRIREALEKALNLSERHEKFIPELEAVRGDLARAGSSEKARALAEEGSFIQSVAEKLYRGLIDVAAATLAIPAASLEDARSVSQRLRSMLASMEGSDFHGAYTHSRAAYIGLNRLAIDLLEANARAGSRGELGKMEEYLRRLEEFANSQADLNEALRRLGASGLPMPAMAQSLQGMALQQALIREGMGELMRDMGNVGEIGRRLDQIEEEMEEVERMLGEMRVDDEVKRRQANVLRRLQDATLSLRKEFFEDKRTAERGREYKAAKPKPLTIRSGEGLPGEIKREMLHYREGKYPEGFERPVEKYYEELLK